MVRVISNRVEDLAPPEDVLCHRCQGLHLTKDKFLPRDDPSSENAGSLPRDLPGLLSADFDPLGLDVCELGYLDEIYRRRAMCSFCWLIFKATHSVNGSNIGYDGLSTDGQRIQCHLDWQLDARMLRDDMTRTGERRADRAISRRIRLSTPQRWFQDAYIMPLSDRKTDGVAEPNFLGRPIPRAHVDVGLLLKWLTICTGRHKGSCHDGPIPQALLEADFINFIDLEHQCLVNLGSMPVDQRARLVYATISYVWGGPAPLTLLSKNYYEFCQPGALRPERYDLPRTLRDVMILIREMGIPYIWIDSLCILQDDPESWGKTAPIMDRIYGNGCLNVCAASGRDASEGIPGTAATARNAVQAISMVGELKLLAVKPVESRIQPTAWNSRAWTFQERMLSRRCLIFVEDRVYFQCREVTWSEEIEAETYDPAWTLEMIGSPMRTSKNPVYQYTESVELYSGRKLTFPGDRLVAFNGFANVLCPSLNATMVYGLPDSYFDWALLWEKTEKGERIQRQETLRETTQFPSWSWCGWFGASTWKLSTLSGTLTNLHEWISMHTWIVWYYGKGKEMKLVWERSPTEGRQGVSRWSGYGPVGCTPYGRNPQHLDTKPSISHSDDRPTLPTSPPMDCCLHFWTYTAQFQLSRRSMANAALSSGVGEGLRRMSLLDRKGDWCGTLVLEDDWASRVGGVFEFAAISEARDFSMDELDTWAYYVPEERDISEWYLYYALLLVWDEERTVAERAGLAKIYKNAFEDASFDPGMAWKEITLG
ncbi:heterokaryon incompatibility protein-domain-containing protein [Xylariomycetidae sp. FL0641]|nr:heterokaryon incompatibility protein-domain-containing protein [Xylariomycetidae sp. FL0641]